MRFRVISDRSIRSIIEINKKCLVGLKFSITSDAKANSFQISPGLKMIVPILKLLSESETFAVRSLVL
ncbi:hypothetical protein [Nostoc sp. CALU 1950]|uniref:hypothetical protein n=1 Tax=Nostoc sp. CALU 1950 TaxID=3104321 RepID=UPI003EBDD7CC